MESPSRNQNYRATTWLTSSVLKYNIRFIYQQMADISQTSQRSENIVSLFFFKKNMKDPPPNCISDHKAKHAHIGNIRTLLRYVARIFTFLQPKINDARHGAQLKRWTAILYKETHT